MAMQRLKNGTWGVAPRRREFFGIVHRLATETGNAVGVGAIGATDSVQIDGQADFLASALAASFNNAQGNAGEIKVQFLIQPDRNLFQVPVFVGTLGVGLFPRRLQMPQLVPRAQTFSMVADDRRTVQVGTTSVRALHIGQKVYERPFEASKAYHEVLPYDFVANFTANDGGIGALAANGSNVFPINVFSDTDFDIYHVTIIADGDATLQVETSGKSLQWFNRPCHIDLLGGSPPNATIPSGARPFTLPSPSRVPAAGSIIVSVADLSGALNRVQVIFHGLRMRPPGGLPMDPRSFAGYNVGTGGIAP